MQKVSLIKQENYNLDELIVNIRQSLNNIINMDEIFTEGKTVMLKVNAVSNMNYDHGYTTHPMFLKALIRVLKDYPVKIIVSDNHPFNSIKSTLKGNGTLKVIEEENVTLADNHELKEISSENYLQYKSFNVSKTFVEADIMINLPKLKTHSFTYFSCAQKNLFGLIYGLEKANWHVIANNPKDFGTMINDLYCITKEQFKENHLIHLCDSIECLQGDGPTTGGNKTKMNAIFASTSGVALDIVGLKMAGLDLEKSFITTTALKNNIELSNKDDIEVIGNYFEQYSLEEPEKPLGAIKLLNNQFMKNLLLEHPIVDKDKCLKCGACAKICPKHTMRIKQGEYPKLKTNQCIRCWCCSEVCPVSAISKSKRPLLGKIIIKE